MNVSIKLPNYESFRNDLGNYFDQLELAVYHARKSYERIRDSVSKPEDIIFWISPVGIDGSEAIIKKIESADKSKDKDREEVWMDSMQELEMNISY